MLRKAAASQDSNGAGAELKCVPLVHIKGRQRRSGDKTGSESLQVSEEGREESEILR